MAEDKSIAQETLDAVNLARAVRMRARGVPWSKVAKECEFPSPRAALEAVGKAMAEATMRAEMTVDQYRDEATMRLEHLLGETLDMLDADAPETYDAEGNPLTSDDRAVKLRAVDEARRLTLELAKLGGADKAPATDDDKESGGIRIIGVAVEDIV